VSKSQSCTQKPAAECINETNNNAKLNFASSCSFFIAFLLADNHIEVRGTHRLYYSLTIVLNLILMYNFVLMFFLAGDVFKF
jgi:hypothetical protein